MDITDQQSILRALGLLTPEEAASELGVTPDTIRQYARREHVPFEAVRIGGRVFIPLAEVERWRNTPNRMGPRRRASRTE